MPVGVMYRGGMCVGVSNFRYGKVLSGLEDVLEETRWHGGYRRCEGVYQEVV
jgi:hypothetical protein